MPCQNPPSLADFDIEVCLRQTSPKALEPAASMLPVRRRRIERSLGETQTPKAKIAMDGDFCLRPYALAAGGFLLWFIS
jgi:hypothetical protein